jgi:DNA-binding MurR/RpiR family transcriptional regulator
MFEDLSNRINKLPKLTKAEGKLVAYFQEIKDQLALKNIYEISNGANVSVATVTRFVSRLGYADFLDFKKQLKRALLNKVGSQWDTYQKTRAELLEGEGELWTRFSNLVINELKAVHATNPPERLAKVAEMIHQAKGTVYVIGQLNSYAIAYFFWQQLVLLCPGTVFLDNQAGNLVHRLLEIKKDDLIFAVSYTSYSQQTTGVIQEFAEKEAQVVVLTDSDVSPVSRWADVQLVVPLEWNAIMSSRCSGLMLVEALVLHLAQLKKDEMGERVERAQLLSNKFNLFEHPGSRKDVIMRRLDLCMDEQADMDDKDQEKS